MKYITLIEGWRNLEIDKAPYLFDGDEQVITSASVKTCLFKTVDEYIENLNFGRVDDKCFHLGLLPVPYVGNLQKSSVFILMLNPGFSLADYFEQNILDFKKYYKQNLYQENSDAEYPFLFLNPHLAWHPGFAYWHRKFSNILNELVKNKGISYLEALKLLSQNVACLELVPYHSKSFGAYSLTNKLPSIQAMLDFVHHVLLPKVKRDKAVIIVTRSGKFWDLPNHDNIIVYLKAEAQGAHLTIKSRGGKAIAKQIGLELNIKPT